MKYALFILMLLTVFTATPTTAQSVSQLSSAEGRGIYRVLCYTEGPDRRGSGFLHKSGVVITAAHVVSGCDSLKVVTTRRDTVIADVYPPTEDKLAAIDMYHDLAILYPADSLEGRPLELHGNTSIRWGEPLSAWGYPLNEMGRFPLASYGFIVNQVRLRRNWEVYVMNVSLFGGFSGGPVLDNRKTVVGVIVRKYNLTLPTIQKNIEWLRTLEIPGVDSLHRDSDTLSVGEVLAETLKFFDDEQQYGFGYVTSHLDVKAFLKQHGIDP